MRNPEFSDLYRVSNSEAVPRSARFRARRVATCEQHRQSVVARFRRRDAAIAYPRRAKP